MISPIYKIIEKVTGLQFVQHKFKIYVKNEYGGYGRTIGTAITKELPPGYEYVTMCSKCHCVKYSLLTRMVTYLHGGEW